MNMVTNTHILFAMNKLPYGYGGPYFSRWDSVASLAASCRKLTVYSEEDITWPEWFDSERKRGVEWLCNPTEISLPPFVNREWIRLLPRYIQSVRKCQNYLRKLNRCTPDIIWADTQFAHRFLQRRRDWNVSRKVICMRGSPEQAERIYLDGQSQLKRVIAELRTYTHLASVSERVGRMWLAYPELQHLKMLYLPNCAREEQVKQVITEERSEVRTRLGMHPEDVVVVCPASIQPRKGQDLLLKVWPKLVAECPSISCFCVGPAGNTWFINKEVQQAGMPLCFSMLGFKPNILDYIHAADLIVLPSREEAMPLAILESMAMGKAIVASNVGGIPELISHGMEGLVFECENEIQMSEYLVRLYHNNEERVNMGKTAANKYWAVYSREHHRARYQKAVAAVMESI